MLRAHLVNDPAVIISCPVLHCLLGAWLVKSLLWAGAWSPKGGGVGKRGSNGHKPISLLSVPQKGSKGQRHVSQPECGRKGERVKVNELVEAVLV